MNPTESFHFVFDERQIDRVNGRLEPWAFTPRKQDGRFRLSTCQDNNLTDEAAWELGERLRAFKQSRKRGPEPVELLGRADMQAPPYGSRGLEFNPSPFAAVPEHVDVVGWEKAAMNLETTHEQIALAISLESLFIPTPFHG